MSNITLSWMNKHFQSSGLNIIHTGKFQDEMAKSKYDICKELGISLILEDNKKTSLECATNGMDVILFDQPWNQGLTHKNITRVKDWKEAMSAFNKLTKLNN